MARKKAGKNSFLRGRGKALIKVGAQKRDFHEAPADSGQGPGSKKEESGQYKI